MNFDFSDDQKLLKDQVHKFLRDKCDRSVVRRILEGDEPCAKEVWQGLTEMGLAGTVIPEAYGGVGLGYLELCVVAEELGRAVAPVPFSSSVYLATEALLLAGSEEQKQAYLTKLASGALIGTLAYAEGTQAPTAKNVAVTLSGGKLSGTKVPVPDGDIADFAVVVARTAQGAGDNTLSLALVDLTGAGVSRETIGTIDPTRSHAQITFDNAPADMLGAEGAGQELVRKVFDKAAVLFAFEQVGGASAALEMATEYAKERVAFGRPIGSFQAIKHKLAEIYIRNTLAQSHAYYAAWALSTDAPELPLAAAAARVAATDAYDYAAKENHQTHGGMGFTWEMDCQFFYRRARLQALALGAIQGWKDKLVSALETSNAA